MTAFDPTQRIGRVPCWALRFFDEAAGGGRGAELLVVDHGAHTAEIAVTLPGGLRPGSVSVTIGRLRADAFGTLAAPQLQEVARGDNGRPGRKRIYMELAMWWANPLSLAGDFDASRVIETFRVTSMSREVDGLDVVTKIEGRRALYDRLTLMRTPAGDGIEAADTLAGVSAVLAAAGLAEQDDFVVHRPDGPPAPNPQRLPPATPVLRVLEQLRQQMVRQPPYRRGRPLYLMRGGRLHAGPWRPIPHGDQPAGGLGGAALDLVTGGGVKAMTAEVGLLSVTSAGTAQALAADETAVGDAPPDRASWQLRAAGRQDIQPGDVLSFRKPSEAEGLFGGFGLPSLPAGLGAPGDETVHLYVSDVAHKLGRAEGWLTTVTGVEVGEGGADAWDVVQTRDGDLPEDGDEAGAATPAARVARSVRRRISHALASRPVSAMGEVRGHATATTEANGVVQTAAQTLTVLRGILDLGGPRQARLDAIDRDRNDLQSNIPYLTPFAWGPFGHVLPRYPGMRVMMLNHRSQDTDPVEVGALWQTPDAGADRTPTNTEAGDWWLILPAYGDADPPGPAAGTDPVPAGPAHASHDLIAASGERVIEVNGFVIRAMTKDALHGPADRPVGATGDAKGGLVIEQVDGGSSIRLLPDGTVEIVSGEALSITAGADMTLTADNIRLVARSGGTVDASNA